MYSNIEQDGINKLIPAGFQQQREHFFLVQEANILVLYKRYHRGSFAGYYLAFTHTFFSDVTEKKGKYTIPPYLENYPISISISEIQTQFRKYNFIEEFDCDLSFITREILPPRMTTLQEWIIKYLSLGKRVKPKDKLLLYSNNPIEVLLNEGVKFLKQFSPLFTYQVLTKYGDLNNILIDKQISECLGYLSESNTKIK